MATAKENQLNRDRLMEDAIISIKETNELIKQIKEDLDKIKAKAGIK